MNDINELKRRAGITESRQKLNESLLMMLHAVLDTYVKEVEQGSTQTAVEALRAKGLDEETIRRIVDLYNEFLSKQQVKAGY